MSFEDLAFESAFKVSDGQTKYGNLRAFDGESGVYAIWSPSGACLYVGESHSGRLGQTIGRHFRSWSSPRTLPGGRRRGGTMYQAEKVRVSVMVASARDVQALQFAAIQQLSPRDNEVSGDTVVRVVDLGDLPV